MWSRLDELENCLRPFKWTWGFVANNRVLAPAFFGGGFVVVEVLWGRIRDYGVHEVALSIGIYTIAVLLIYLVTRKKDSIKMMLHG